MTFIRKRGRKIWTEWRKLFSNLVDNALKYLRKDVQGRINVFELSGVPVQDRPGEGLGLAHVRALVRRLGGSIAVDSTPGEGAASSRVSLPPTLVSEARRISA